MSDIKTIALVDWNWRGHHPAAFNLFARALLELGCTVLALCPRPGEVDLALRDLDAETRARLTLDCTAPPGPPRGCPRRLRRAAGRLREACQLRKRIRQWEALSGRPVELVFFACIYDYEFRRFPDVAWLLPCPWSGLYLHCRAYRKPGSVVPQTGELPCPERIFGSAKLHSIALFDEGAVTAMEHLSRRPVVVFPDLTDEQIDSTPTPLMTKIKNFAAGAPVVALLGHLQHTKGVATLARLALDPANQDLCFVFAGEIDSFSFKPEDRALLSNLTEGHPNIFTHFERIPDERTFNSAVQASDVLFAAYLDFPNSSGIQTKASVFRKPIIVSDGYLMAERTREYSLGEVVPEGDVAAAGGAIRRILKDQGAWIGEHRPKWKEYHAKHCYERLKDSFALLLAAS